MRNTIRTSVETINLSQSQYHGNMRLVYFLQGRQTNYPPRPMKAQLLLGEGTKTLNTLVPRVSSWGSRHKPYDAKWSDEEVGCASWVHTAIKLRSILGAGQQRAPRFCTANGHLTSLGEICHVSAGPGTTKE